MCCHIWLNTDCDASTNLSSRTLCTVWQVADGRWKLQMVHRYRMLLSFTTSVLRYQYCTGKDEYFLFPLQTQCTFHSLVGLHRPECSVWDTFCLLGNLLRHRTCMHVVRTTDLLGICKCLNYLQIITRQKAMRAQPSECTEFAKTLQYMSFYSHAV